MIFFVLLSSHVYKQHLIKIINNQLSGIPQWKKFFSENDHFNIFIVELILTKLTPSNNLFYYFSYLLIVIPPIKPKNLNISDILFVFIPSFIHSIKVLCQIFILFYFFCVQWKDLNILQKNFFFTIFHYGSDFQNTFITPY